MPKPEQVKQEGPRRQRQLGLNIAEYKELAGLYISYYEVDCYSTHNLRRMYQLESKATDTQLTVLLAKYGLTLDDVFN